MKVILLSDVKKVGKKDQIVEVSNGYAQNFLFPKHLAVPSSDRSREILSIQQEKQREQEEINISNAKELAKKLESITLQFQVKVGKEGKLFGNISLKQVADKLEEEFSITIDKRKFVSKEPLNSLGIYRVEVELYKGVKGVVKVNIESENK